MQIIILADELQRAELSTTNSDENIVWIKDQQEFLQFKDADAFIDLEFIDDEGRKELLALLLPKPVIINSVTDTLAEINGSFVRINGWPTFLTSTLVEAAGHEMLRPKVEEVFTAFNRKIEWLQDEPGFITARVISMMINEAFISLGEGISTREEINTAMKLGTAYPYGPFEWAEKIGLQKIVTLLQKLSQTQSRYVPAELLVEETGNAI